MEEAGESKIAKTVEELDGMHIVWEKQSGMVIECDVDKVENGQVYLRNIVVNGTSRQSSREVDVAVMQAAIEKDMIEIKGPIEKIGWKPPVKQYTPYASIAEMTVENHLRLITKLMTEW